MNWLYKLDGIETEIDDKFISSSYGFVYKTINLKTNKFYIGKKSFIYNKKKKLGKKELASLPITRGRNPVTKIEQVDSGWRDYYGSSKELTNDIKTYGKENFKRIILDFYDTKKQQTYFELHYQITERVLFVDSYNDNIQGRFFRKDFDTPKKDVIL